MLSCLVWGSPPPSLRWWDDLIDGHGDYCDSSDGGHGDSNDDDSDGNEDVDDTNTVTQVQRHHGARQKRGEVTTIIIHITIFIIHLTLMLLSQSLFYSKLWFFHNRYYSPSLLFTIMFLPPPSPLSTQVDGTIWFKAPVGLGIGEQRRLW